MKAVFLAVIFVIAIAIACPPPTLPPGSRWVANKNCTRGTVYETVSPPPRERCRCWGYCGYICSSSSGTTTTTTTTTTTKKPSPCPFGGVYFNAQGERCVCQSSNQQPYYRCTPTTTTPATT